MSEPLDAGDVIEVAVTLSVDYNSVRYGATSTIRDDETVEEAQKRVEDFVFENASRVLDEILE